MSNLLDQWNEHKVRGNQLSRELEDIEDILEKSKGSDICFSSGANGAIFIRVLSVEKMQALRESVVLEIIKTRNDKAVELEKLMGIRKPAVINPEFEAAVQGMVQSKDKPIVIDPTKDEPEFPPVTKTPSTLPGKNILNKGEDTKEMNLIVEDKLVPPKPSEILENHVAEIEKMYKVDMATVGAIAEKFGVKKTDVNTFLAKHKLFRKAYKKEDGFLDAKVDARQKQPAETECL